MDELTKKSVKGYDATVEEYYAKTRDLLEGPQLQQRQEFMSLLKEGARILDLGCGPGRDAKLFSEQGFKVMGADLSSKMIEKARTVAPKAEFKMMDILDLDFDDESFEGVWFCAGLLCTQKKFALKVLKDINRILTKQGILFVSVKEGKGEGFELDKRYNVEKYYAYYTEDEISRLLADAGFEILKLYKPALKSPYHTHQWIDTFCRKKAPKS